MRPGASSSGKHARLIERMRVLTMTLHGAGSNASMLHNVEASSVGARAPARLGKARVRCRKLFSIGN